MPNYFAPPQKIPAIVDFNTPPAPKPDPTAPPTPTPAPAGPAPAAPAMQPGTAQGIPGLAGPAMQPGTAQPVGAGKGTVQANYGGQKDLTSHDPNITAFGGHTDAGIGSVENTNLRDSALHGSRGVDSATATALADGMASDTAKKTTTAAGANEARPDFQRVDGPAGPSDFVGFAQYAGLNDDAMRDIADRAEASATQKRADAQGLYKQASTEAGSGKIEDAPSYQKYLDAIKNAGDTAKAAVDKTSNPYEDALRSVYFDSQAARDKRLTGDSLANAGATAQARDKYFADTRTATATEQTKQDAASKKKSIADALAKKTADDAAYAKAMQAAKEKAVRDSLPSLNGGKPSTTPRTYLPPGL